MTDRTKPVSARLPIEVVEDIEKRLKNDDLSLREMLTKYAETGFQEPKTGVNTTSGISVDGISEEVISDLKSMIHLCGLSEGRFWEEIDRLMNEGGLTVEGMEVVPHGELDMTSFYEVCHAKGYEPQETLEKVVKLLWK